MANQPQKTTKRSRKTSDAAALTGQADVDLLTLAYRLVVARHALPRLLESWNAAELLEAAQRVAPESPTPLVDASRLLEQQLGNLEPEPLWRAWMETRHADVLERLRREVVP